MTQAIMALLLLLAIWTTILTIFFVRFYLYYTKATSKGKKQSLIELLDTVLKKDEQREKEVERLNRYCSYLEEKMSLQIQKVGLLRFNPFNDTGGDQSFILALVDEHNTGVIISGLHTRAGTRWYAKKVIKGKGIEHDLSKDELLTLKDAKPLDSGYAKSVERNNG